MSPSYSRELLKTITSHAIGGALEAAIEYLRDKYGEGRFEISIFHNREEPDILFYRDSVGNKEPSSADGRRKEPQYYRAHKYEAVELLDNPSDRILIYPSLTTLTATYSFATEEQKKRIRSTVLHSFTFREPHVLVLVADRKSVFQKDDSTLIEFVGCLGHALHYDLWLYLQRPI